MSGNELQSGNLNGSPVATQETQLIRIVLADDHPIVRDGLKKLLVLEEDIAVVGEASDGREVLDVIEQTHPDVVILDLRMPNMDGLAALDAHSEARCRSPGSSS